MPSTKFPSNSSSSKLALLAACGAGVLWGTGALVVNVLVAQHGFTPENVSFWRFLIGAVVLVGIFGRRIIWSQLRPILLTVLIAGTAMSGYVLLWFLGIEQMGAAIPTLIALCVPPVIVTIIAVFRGQETADLQLILMLSGAIVGTVLIITQHGSTTSAVNSHSIFVLYWFSVSVSWFIYDQWSYFNRSWNWPSHNMSHCGNGNNNGLNHFLSPILLANRVSTASLVTLSRFSNYSSRIVNIQLGRSAT